MQYVQFLICLWTAHHLMKTSLSQAATHNVFHLNLDRNETIGKNQKEFYHDKLAILQKRQNAWRCLINNAAQFIHGFPLFVTKTKRKHTQKGNQTKAPHIVLFLADDWAWNNVLMVRTISNINSLTFKGIKLTNYYAHDASSRFSVLINDTEPEVSLAEELKSVGYRTNLVDIFSGTRALSHHGFDHFYGHQGLMNDASQSELLHSTEAVRVIHDHAANHATEPMFLRVTFRLMQTPRKHLEHFAQCVDEDFKKREFCSMRLMLDKAVGEVVSALTTADMINNTVFVMMSDAAGDEHSSRSALRVPAFIVAPEALIPSSRVGGEYSGEMHVADWLPTLMGIAAGGQWGRGLRENDVKGTDMWSTLVDNTFSDHPEVMRHLDDVGRVSLQKGMIKLVRRLRGSNPGALTEGERLLAAAAAGNNSTVLTSEWTTDSWSWLTLMVSITLICGLVTVAVWITIAVCAHKPEDSYLQLEQTVSYSWSEEWCREERGVGRGIGGETTPLNLKRRSQMDEEDGVF